MRNLRLSHISELALDWAIRAFGREHVMDTQVRGLRIAEEAIELLQSNAIPKETVLHLVEIVYSRPRGNSFLELGGVALTATVYSAAVFNQDVQDVCLQELNRVLSTPLDHFAKRNEEKNELGLGRIVT